ncbi:HMG box-containing protein 1 isoform X2 [Nematostella vectensis]|uniref:HMG box-containing protein 1 isoform X2 n=1 Tax=Nematostella vectensis TaxID=45351 RepID=UPI002077309B|nr:HMG box-containing protein 1 isoform X2 [Nematostella vectensis]
MSMLVDSRAFHVTNKIVYGRAMQPKQNPYKPHACPRCHKSFKSSNGLKYHNGKAHSDNYVHEISANQVMSKPSKKPIPPALELRSGVDSMSPEMTLLTEFALIATSPQSPLMQTGYDERFCNPLHQDSPPRPEDSPPPGLVDPRDIDYDIPSVESELSTSPGPDSTTYRYATPPPTVWNCFLDGTRVQLEGESDWRFAEDLGNDDIPRVSLPEEGLKLTSCHRVDLNMEEKEYVLATFHSTTADQPSLRAEVACGHPFFVKAKGWSSFRPSLTAEQYGIICQTLACGDVCLPSSHPDVLKALRMRRSSSMFDFTDVDSTAALTLSCMAKVRQEHKTRKTKLLSTLPPRMRKTPSQLQQLNKRPMNAFMLFAKRYRLEITQAHPGKDNRAISVILGDKWKSMKQEERKQYVMEAKQLAEEHKKGRSKGSGYRRV